MENRSTHTLETRSIVLRQVDDESTFIEDNGGVYIPIVRVRDTVITFADLKAFNLEIGKSFLPQLVVSIDDSDFSFRETDFVEGIELVTVFVGSSRDEINIPIKNDYVIKRVSSSPGSSTITFDCELYVPKLYEAINRSFESSSLEVIETVASDCGLGFTTNVASADDSMIWIQYQNHIDFLIEVNSRSYISDTTKTKIFVDQFANLNYVDLSAAINGSFSHQLEVNPTNGITLEEPQSLILSSDSLNTENLAKISSYTPISNYVVASKKFTSTQTFDDLDFNDYSTVESRTTEEINVQLAATTQFGSELSENTHNNFCKSIAINTNNNQLTQGTKLILKLDWSIQSLYMMQVVQTEVFNIAKKEEIKSTEETVNMDQMLDEETPQENNSHTLNESLSGNLLILAMKYTYLAKSTRDESRLRQTIEGFLI